MEEMNALIATVKPGPHAYTLSIRVNKKACCCKHTVMPQTDSIMTDMRTCVNYATDSDQPL